MENPGFVATQLYRLAAGAALPLVLCAGAPHDGLVSQMPQNFVIAPEIEVGLQRLVELYEQLTPACLSRLSICYAPHVPFKGPFNEVRGQDGIRQIFAHIVYDRGCSSFYSDGATGARATSVFGLGVPLSYASLAQKCVAVYSWRGVLAAKRSRPCARPP